MIRKKTCAQQQCSEWACQEARCPWYIHLSHHIDCLFMISFSFALYLLSFNIQEANPSPDTSPKLALATTKLWATLSQRYGISRLRSTNPSFLGKLPWRDSLTRSNASIQLLSRFLGRTTGGLQREIPYSRPPSLVWLMGSSRQGVVPRKSRHSCLMSIIYLLNWESGWNDATQKNHIEKSMEGFWTGIHQYTTSWV